MQELKILTEDKKSHNVELTQSVSGEGLRQVDSSMLSQTSCGIHTSLSKQGLVQPTFGKMRKN